MASDSDSTAPSVATQLQQLREANAGLESRIRRLERCSAANWTGSEGDTAVRRTNDRIEYLEARVTQIESCPGVESDI